MLDTFVEPFGHSSRLSKLERVWEKRVPGTSIRRQRIQSFDPLSGVSFSPMEYWFEPIDYSQIRLCPDGDWIANAFFAFVKGEFASGAEHPPIPEMPEISDRQLIDSDIYQEYMLSCERQMLYAYYRRSNRHTEQNLVDNIKALLTDTDLGNKKNLKFAPFDNLRSKLDEWARHESRLLCILPSFPFKDQSLLRAGGANPDEFDLGEVALMIRLHLLSLAFYQFHPWGVDWLIAADGNFYADMFGVPKVAAASYFERMRTERSHLNINGTVSFLDLEEIIDHYKAGCEAEFKRDKAAIYARIADISKTEGTEERKVFEVLKRGMRQNQSTREFEDDVDVTDLWKICNWETLNEDASEHTKELHKLVGDRAVEISIAYAAENIVLKRHNVLEKVFPESIRTTIHAKPGQVAVPQIGSCFPWNGVAFHPETNQIDARTLEVVRFHELRKFSKKITANVDRKTGATLFYSS